MSSLERCTTGELHDARRLADAKLRLFAILFADLSLAEAVTVSSEIYEVLRDDLQRREARLQ
jgi:hypothetical protein